MAKMKVNGQAATTTKAVAAASIANFDQLMKLASETTSRKQQSNRNEGASVETIIADPATGEDRPIRMAMAAFDEIGDNKEKTGKQVFGIRVYGIGGKGGARWFTPWQFKAMFCQDFVDAAQALLGASGTPSSDEETEE